MIDLYSVSARHYINGGDPAIKHFHMILNDINNYAVDELHAVHAVILYKSHGKDKTSDRSYRTISSCPFIVSGEIINLKIRFRRNVKYFPTLGTKYSS